MIAIGEPEPVPYHQVCIGTIPDHVLTKIRNKSCTIMRAGESINFLIGPGRERLGEFTASFDSHPPSYEVLRRFKPDFCCPMPEGLKELTFKCRTNRLEAPLSRPKKKAVPISSTRTPVSNWSSAQAFQSLQGLRDRFEDSRRGTLQLLNEMQAALERNGPEVSTALLKQAYQDGLALAAEQNKCIGAAHTLAVAIIEK
jgi:hypothetical protein